jgi:hypothetical protein
VALEKKFSDDPQLHPSANSLWDAFRRLKHVDKVEVAGAISAEMAQELISSLRDSKTEGFET